MPMPVKCEIVSAEEQIFSGQVELLSAIAAEGELGVQYGHAALLTPLKPGPVRLVKLGGSEEVIYVSGGYLEVQPHLITVLADVAVRAQDIDEAAAAKARDHAISEITNSSSEMDHSRVAAELAEATAQLLTLQKTRKKLGG